MENISNKEKMLKGLLYDPADQELSNLRHKAHQLCALYNQITDEGDPRRSVILKELLNVEELPILQGPIQFDYGLFTHFGKNCYANFNLTILDVCPVTIGDNVLFGPNVTIATPLHPMYYEERRLYEEDGVWKEMEYGKPITIGNDVWIASNVVICAGVTIGDGCVIGAGSVVTHDVEAYTLACGNPCRVIRHITEKDKLKKELF